MNKTVLMIMGGAVLVAILVAMIVQAKLAPSKEEVANTVSGTEILVASKKLLTGERLTAESVRWQAVPPAAAFTGVILKSEEPDLKKLSVYDSPLKRDIEEGEPVTRQAMIADVKGEGNFITAILRPGMRAVGIKVNAITGAGGFVSPGDRVDVIVVYTARLPNTLKPIASSLVQRDAAQTVVSNARVLGVDQESAANRPAKAAKTVTIEVTKEQAEILALAEKMGDLSVAIRRLGEKDVVGGEITPITTDVNASEVMRKLNQVLNESSATGDTVRVYNGSQIENVPVRRVRETQEKQP